MPRRPAVDRLTGPIGCGKSTVAGWLGERPGVVVIDADVVAREVARARRAGARRGRRAVRGRTAPAGRDARPRGARPDRVRRRRGACATSRRSSIPPSGRGSWPPIDAAEAAGADAVVVEAIKLVEGGLADLCDEVWLVTCDPVGPASSACVGRGTDPADATSRIAAQGDLAERLRPAATRVIDTSGPPDAVRAEVEGQFRMAMASSSP